MILYLAGFSCHNSVLLNVIVTVNKGHVRESLGKILHELAKFHKICYDEGQADETRDTTWKQHTEECDGCFVQQMALGTR